MLGRIRNLPQAVKVGFYWVKATDMASRSNYDEALEYLEKIEAITKSMPDVSLLKGLMYLKLERHEECIRTMIESAEQIAEYRKYSEADKLYLKGYASLCCNRSANALGMPNQTLIQVDLQKIDPTRVQQKLKDIFPLKSK